MCDLDKRSSVSLNFKNVKLELLKWFTTAFKTLKFITEINKVMAEL